MLSAWKQYADGDIVAAVARVRHSYSSKPPLQPWVLVRKSGCVVAAHCTCMAGLAETCSHVGATLHWLEAAVRCRDETPCTSKENTWAIPKPIHKIPYLELKDIPFSKMLHQVILL
eukprot:m.259698 g.259698  ORF g.259698 m.259698 type:complete len:116 (+) comp40426_c1_seq10:15-362(+)